MSARPDDDGATVEEPAGFVVSGVVRYDDGRAPPHRCRFEILSLDYKTRASVDAVEGLFQARMDRPARCVAFDVVADGARCEGRLVADLAYAGAKLDLVLPVPRSITLRVVGAEDREPVAGVRAWRATGGFGGHPWKYTPEGEAVLGDREGRVALGPSTGSECWWLLAPGRAWTPAWVTFDAGPTITVVMPAGGDLDVTATHVERALGTEIYIYWRGADRAYERLPDLGPSAHLLVHGVPVGDGVIEAYLDGDLDEPVCRSLAATIRSDALAAVSIEFERTAPRVPVVRSAGVAGSIELSEGWPDEPPFVAIGPVEWRARSWTRPRVWREPSDPPRRYRFGSDSEPIGPCVVSVFCGLVGRPHAEADVVFTRRLELVPAAAMLDVRVPPPKELRVRAVDVVSLKPVDGARVFWSSWVSGIDDPEYRRVADQDASRHDKTAGLWRIPVVAGSYRVAAMADGYAWISEDVEIGDGDVVDRTLRLHRAATVVVRLQIDGRPAFIDEFAVAFEGAGHTRKETSSRGQVVLRDVEVGPATITFEAFTGFVTPTPIPLELKAGETKDVVVELKRAD